MADRIKIKSKIDNIFGICCYHLLPIQQEYYLGKGRIIAICTLSSLDLLKEIKNNNLIMEKISIVGRLLSKKKGIDQNKKVINAAAPYPFLACSNDEIEYFRQHINIINKIGLKDIDKIKDIVFDI